MSGNVIEWCHNAWASSPVGGNDPVDPSPESASYRILRGGSWDHSANGCRSAYRGSYPPSGRLNTFGFRIVRTK